VADNLGYTPGSGASIKTDQGGVSGAHMSVVKLAHSADGSETLITADGDGLEVQIGKSIDLTVEPKAATAFPVTDNGGNLSVDDGAGSLTVDAPASAPVAVRLSSGAAFVDAVPVTDNASTLSVDDGGGAITVDGAVTAAQGAPVAVASAWPTKISDGSDTVGISTVGSEKALKVDVVNPETAPIAVSPVRPAETRLTKSVTLGAAETGTTIWDPAAGKKFVVTDVIIAVAESGRLTLFDGTDSAANRLFDGMLYGAIWHLNFQARPWASSTADNILKATTDADAEATVTVHGYEV
jgi:hypothetical protein